MSKSNYKSDIKLGESYRDEQTGYEGIATAITFFQFACERVSLETYDAQRREVKTEVFDSPRLTHKKTGVRAEVKVSGGPGEPLQQRGMLSR